MLIHYLCELGITPFAVNWEWVFIIRPSLKICSLGVTLPYGKNTPCWKLFFAIVKTNFLLLVFYTCLVNNFLHFSIKVRKIRKIFSLFVRFCLFLCVYLHKKKLKIPVQIFWPKKKKKSLPAWWIFWEVCYPQQTYY